MPIALTEPIITTSKELVEVPKEYTSVWVGELTIHGTPPQSAVRVVFHPWNPTTNEFDLRQESEKVMVIPDLFAAAEEDAQLGALVNSLIVELERQGKLRGVL